MNTLQSSKNHPRQFVILAYALFWVMVLLIGLIGYVLLDNNTYVIQIGTIIAAWVPTISFLVMFKKIFPDRSIKSFYKEAFSTKINIPMVIVITIIQVIIFVTAVYISSIQDNVSFLSLIRVTPSIFFPGMITTLLGGPMGEETGWRGYLQPALEKKSSLIKSSLKLSIIWMFWHAPIWLTLGLNFDDLIKYVIGFLLYGIPFTVIIGISYYHNRNLFIPIWIHFIANFSMTIYASNVANYVTSDIFFSLAGLHAIAAIGFIIWHKRKENMQVRKIV